MLTFLAVLGGPIAGLFKAEPSYRLAKVVGGIVLVLLVLALLGIGKCTYDRGIIGRHDDRRNAQIAGDTLDADRAADKGIVIDQEDFDAFQNNLTNAAAEARATDPVNATKAVGPVSRSYYDNLDRRTR